MLAGQVFYHGIIRKTIVAFGSLFSNIQIQRKSKDGTDTTLQTIKVPVAYAPKEKWIVRIEQDPTLENTTYTVLPRMSFEVTSISYDSSRKLNRMNKMVQYKAPVGAGLPSYTAMYTPVPYNIDISLYILTKTQEDAMQIVEQILPYFTPEFTLSLNTIPGMSVANDIPVILNSVSVQDDYDGDFQTRRFVTYTLTFNLKVNLYGPTSNGTPIKSVLVDTTVIKDGPTVADYTATQTTPPSVITETWNEEF